LAILADESADCAALWGAPIGVFIG